MPTTNAQATVLCWSAVWCGFLPPLSCVWAIISDSGQEGRAEIHPTANTEGRREEWVTRAQKLPQERVGGCRHGPFSRETSAGAVLWCRNLQMWEGRAGVSEQREGAMKIFPILPCLYLASSFFWEGLCPLSLAGLACRVTHSVFARPRSGSERFCSLPPALKMIGLPAGLSHIYKDESIRWDGYLPVVSSYCLSFFCCAFLEEGGYFILYLVSFLFLPFSFLIL